MNSLLLVTLPAWGVEMPPLGPALIQASLKEKGHSCECLDLNVMAFAHLKKSGLGWLWEKDSLSNWGNLHLFETKVLPHLTPLIEEWILKLTTHKATVIGFTLWDSNIHLANLIMEKIRLLQPKRILLAGGPQMTFKEMRVKLSKACTHYLVGEGEEAVSEYLNALNQNQELPSGFYQVAEELHRDLPYRQLSSMKSQPIPDFTDFGLHPYGTQAAPIILTRSCLFKCRFCSDWVSMGSFRRLDSEQMEKLFRRIWALGYRELWFNDLLINGILQPLSETLMKLKDEGIRFEFIALATPNAQLRSSLLQDLKSCGLKTLNLGLESGSPRIMKAMKKGFDLKQAEAALKRIHEAGIHVQLNMIVGFPQETEEDFLESLRFLERNRPYISGFTSVNTCILIPGSEIHLRRHELGLEMPEKHPEQWSMPGNNPQIRQDRLNRLLGWISDRGFAVYTSNRPPHGKEAGP